MSEKQKLYKMTDEKGQTYGGCQWGAGVTHTAPGTGALCTNGWLHAYTDPLLAVLLDPIHGKHNQDNTGRLWEAEGVVGKTDQGLKVGCAELTTVREVEKPAITREQRVRFGILCAQGVCTNEKWLAWARGWLNNSDRSAANAAYAAAYTAANAANAAYAAADAAYAAADSYQSIDLAALARRAVEEEPGDE